MPASDRTVDPAVWMERIKSLPRGFDVWAYRVAFKGQRYMMLEIEDGLRTLTCKACGCSWRSKAKVGERVRCPGLGCRTMGTVKSEKRNGRLRHSAFVAVVQRIPGAVVVRTVCCTLWFEETPAKLTHSETRRVVWPDGARAPLKYGLTWWAKTGPEWILSQHSHDSYPNIVHPCCRAALKRTRWQYSGLPEAGALGEVPVEMYLRSYLRYPAIEMLAKQGMRNMMLAAVEAGRPTNKLEARLRGKPAQIVGIPHRYWPIVRALDLRPGEVEAVAQLVNAGYQPTLNDARTVLEDQSSYYGDRRWAGLLFHRFGDVLDYRTTMDYLAKQAPRIRTDYRDYLEMARRLELDLHDPDLLRPADLKTAHDRLATRVEIVRQAKHDAAIRRMRELKASDLEVVRDGMLTRLPADAADLVREGEALHHCVGSYAERVAKGECIVVFVRQEASPDVPFVTVEVRGGKIVQMRGKNNAAPPPEVERFAQSWSRTIAAGK